MDEVFEEFEAFEGNETERVLGVDIPSRVHLTYYAPGAGLPYTFHVNEDPTTIINSIRAYGFNAGRQTKILSHGWKSDGSSFCPQFVEGKLKQKLKVKCHWEL